MAEPLPETPEVKAARLEKECAELRAERDTLKAEGASLKANAAELVKAQAELQAAKEAEKSLLAKGEAEAKKRARGPGWL